MVRNLGLHKGLMLRMVRNLGLHLYSSFRLSISRPKPRSRGYLSSYTLALPAHSLYLQSDSVSYPDKPKQMDPMFIADSHPHRQYEYNNQDAYTQGCTQL